MAKRDQWAAFDPTKRAAAMRNVTGGMRYTSSYPHMPPEEVERQMLAAVRWREEKVKEHLNQRYQNQREAEDLMNSKVTGGRAVYVHPATGSITYADSVEQAVTEAKRALSHNDEVDEITIFELTPRKNVRRPLPAFEVEEILTALPASVHDA